MSIISAYINKHLQDSISKGDGLLSLGSIPFHLADADDYENIAKAIEANQFTTVSFQHSFSQFEIKDFDKMSLLMFTTHQTPLTTFDFSNNFLNHLYLHPRLHLDAIAAFFVKFTLSNVKKLILRHNGLFYPLFVTNSKDPNVKRQGIKDLSLKIVASLGQGLRAFSENINHLDLSANVCPYGNGGFEALSILPAHLRGTNITELVLRDNGLQFMTLEQIEQFTSGFDGTKVTSLDISDNYFSHVDETRLRALSSGFKNTHVTSLTLSNSGIFSNSVAACAAFAEGFRDTPVQELHLGKLSPGLKGVDNGAIYLDSMKAFIDGLRGTNILKVTLDLNQLPPNIKDDVDFQSTLQALDAVLAENRNPRPAVIVAPTPARVPVPVMVSASMEIVSHKIEVTAPKPVDTIVKEQPVVLPVERPQQPKPTLYQNVLSSEYYTQFFSPNVLDKIEATLLKTKNNDVKVALRSIVDDINTFVQNISSRSERSHDSLASTLTKINLRVHDYLQHELTNNKIINKQPALIAFFKGLIGVLLTVALLFIPLASPAFRTFFFKSSAVRELSNVRDQLARQAQENRPTAI